MEQEFENLEFDNPTDWRELKIYTLLSLPLFAMGAIIVLVGWSPLGTIIFWTWGAFTFFLPVYAELIARPKMVRIQNDGIVMFFRGRKPRIVGWREIRRIETRPGDVKSFIENRNRGGLMKLDGIFPVRLTYEAALAIRNKHDERAWAINK
jgi:hypothetical protein